MIQCLYKEWRWDSWDSYKTEYSGTSLPLMSATNTLVSIYSKLPPSFDETKLSKRKKKTKQEQRTSVAKNIHGNRDLAR